jgi:hypothetical protein
MKPLLATIAHLDFGFNADRRNIESLTDEPAAKKLNSRLPDLTWKSSKWIARLRLRDSSGLIQVRSGGELVTN